ncbi:MAG: pseudouridine synthase [Agarilytica sp.]
MAQIILLNKPFNVLCQFTDKEGRATLADYVDPKKFPRYYPAGRLDYDSEGLVLLTNEGALQHRISHPSQKLEKTYWVQVEGAPTSTDLSPIETGLKLKDGQTLPAKVQILSPPNITDRSPPIRKRKNLPTTWLEIRLSEGKNRQVRRMTAAIGFPTLRLIRTAIGPWSIDQLSPGSYRTEQVHLPKQTTRTRAKK